jgi:hypothetical protein
MCRTLVNALPWMVRSGAQQEGVGTWVVQRGQGKAQPPIHLFIHVTPVAEAHLSNASPFQTAH